jgi:hypothetical protein
LIQFLKLLEVVAKSTGQLEGFTGGGAEPGPGGVLGAAAPLARVGRLKELVARVSGDLSRLQKQVEQTNVTFGAGAVNQLASLVLKSLLIRKGCSPPSSLPDNSLIVFSTRLTAVQFSVELNRFG